MSVGSLDPSKMPCHQAGHGAQKGQGQGTQRCRHAPKDVADLFSDLKRPVSSREVIGHHLWVWRRLVKRHRSSSCSFACELGAGQQVKKTINKSFLDEWWQYICPEDVTVTLVLYWAVGIADVILVVFRNAHSKTLRPRLQTGMWSSGSRSKTDHVPMFRNSGTESLKLKGLKGNSKVQWQNTWWQTEKSFWS